MTFIFKNKSPKSRCYFPNKATIFFIALLPLDTLWAAQESRLRTPRDIIIYSKACLWALARGKHISCALCHTLLPHTSGRTQLAPYPLHPWHPANTVGHQHTFCFAVTCSQKCFIHRRVQKYCIHSKALYLRFPRYNVINILIVKLMCSFYLI